MGTPDFSVPCLRSIINAGHTVSAVFTQPDKPKNRGHKMQMTPVKECALENNIEVYQPLSLRKGGDGEKSLEVLQRLSPDCIVVVAYGQILPKSVLDIPKYGCTRKYREARISPVKITLILSSRSAAVRLLTAARSFLHRLKPIRISGKTRSLRRNSRPSLFRWAR